MLDIIMGRIVSTFNLSYKSDRYIQLIGQFSLGKLLFKALLFYFTNNEIIDTTFHNHL